MNEVEMFNEFFAWKTLFQALYLMFVHIFMTVASYRIGVRVFNLQYDNESKGGWAVASFLFWPITLSVVVSFAFWNRVIDSDE